MQVIFEWLASVGGVKAEKRGRFKDQAWQCLYYIVAFGTGLSQMLACEWGRAALGGNMDLIWKDYPEGSIQLPAVTKVYYLLQLCFWLHQLAVLYIEEWRTDMPMYLFHHFLTIFLVSSSYLMNFSRIGTAILVEQVC